MYQGIFHKFFKFFLLKNSKGGHHEIPNHYKNKHFQGKAHLQPNKLARNPRVLARNHRAGPENRRDENAPQRRRLVSWRIHEEVTYPAQLQHTIFPFNPSHNNRHVTLLPRV